MYNYGKCSIFIAVWCKIPQKELHICQLSRADANHDQIETKPIRKHCHYVLVTMVAWEVMENQVSRQNEYYRHGIFTSAQTRYSHTLLQVCSTKRTLWCLKGFVWVCVLSALINALQFGEFWILSHTRGLTRFICLLQKPSNHCWDHTPALSLSLCVTHTHTYTHTQTHLFLHVFN